jgi:hypothetical protein
MKKNQETKLSVESVKSVTSIKMIPMNMLFDILILEKIQFPSSGDSNQKIAPKLLSFGVKVELGYWISQELKENVFSTPLAN